MQSGQTDYFTTSSPIGIAKSRIDIIKMTCTYFLGNAIIIEKYQVDCLLLTQPIQF
jgi:uncharacterized protein YbcV (DUF1398 family)